VFVKNNKCIYYDKWIGPQSEWELKATKKEKLKAGIALDPWKRIEYNDALELANGKEELVNQYISVQAFATPRKHEKGQPCITPLFWDLDLGEKQKESGLTLEDVRLETVDLVKEVAKLLGVKDIDQAFSIRFSGRNGFHVLVDNRVTGSLPDPDSYKIVKKACLGLRDRHGYKFIDKVVYSSRRVLRVPNTINNKWKPGQVPLYCIELKWKELNWTMNDIIDLATAPRDRSQFQPPKRLEPTGNKVWARMVREHSQLAQVAKLAPRKRIGNLDGEMPVCMQSLMNDGLASYGTRNDALLSLVCFHKEQGMEKEECYELAKDWSINKCNGMSKSDDAERVAQARGTVDWAYSSDETAFICSKIRSTDMPCSGPLCKFVDTNDQKQIEAYDTSISEAGLDTLTGKQVRFEGFVVGKHKRTFNPPRSGTISCQPSKRNKLCKICPRSGFQLKGEISDEPVTITYPLDTSSDAILDIIQDKKDRDRTVFRSLACIPSKCNDWSYFTTGHVTVCEVTLQDVFRQGDHGSNDPFTADAYFMGDPSQIQKSETYTFTGYQHPHPKTRETTFLLDQAETVGMTHLAWEPTEEDAERLKQFRPKEWTKQSVLSQLTDFCDDQAETVHFIKDRRMFDIMVDICYHSVLELVFPGKSGDPERAWVDLLIVGDSGHGKSALAKAKMRHYEAGTRITAETMTRTGLLGGNTKGKNDRHQVNWGIAPQSDTKLLIIEEVHDDSVANKDALKKMTNARSDGVAQLTMAESGKRMCRVRQIWIANPPHGNETGIYFHPVMMAKELFRENEDIRRFDNMIVLRDEDIAIEDVVNGNTFVKQPRYSSADCAMRVVWAWSRSPDQVVFEPETIALCKKYAIEMVKTYHESIKLVDRGDMLNKLYRAAASMAAMTYSTDDDRTLTVRPCHIEVIKHLYEENYRDPSMGYYQYSKAMKTHDEFDDPDERKRVLNEMKNAVGVKQQRKAIVDFINQGGMFSMKDLEESCDISEIMARELVKKMGALKLAVKRSSASWRVTKRGKQIFEELGSVNVQSFAEKAAETTFDGGSGG